MTIDEIRAALHARAADVCLYLIPKGRRNGDEFEVGSLAGEPGESLKVNLNGKVGVWKDFATGEGGDNLLELWRRYRRHSDIRAAMREAAEWLGSLPRQPSRTDEAKPASAAPIPADAPARHPKWRTKPVGRWVYTDPKGNPWLITYRYDTKDGKAFFTFDYQAGKWIEKGGHQLPARRPLYRLHALAGSREVVLVEGEKCADMLVSVGINATTTFGGCGQVGKADFSPLRDCCVIIWPDADKPGRKSTERAAMILRDCGAAEVLLVPIPEGVPDGWDVADAVREGWTPEQIRAQLDMAEPIGPPAVPTERFQLLTDADLERQPDRPDLVKDIFAAASLIVAVAKPAAGKTTLALELAGDVACDLLFHGRPVSPGPVVFIAAEGASKLGLRVRAWKTQRQVKGSSKTYFITEPVRLAEAPEVDALLTALGKLPTPPVLVVVDTLARCMIGADENSARDVGLFIQGCDRIRQKTGAAVLIVHHTTKSGSGERGSGALRGAADTLVLLSREDDLVTVTCDKQKDGAPFEPLHFRLQVVDLGNERSACVLDPVGSPMQGGSDSAPATLPESRRKAAEALADAVNGATFSQWLRLAQEAFRLSESTFTRAVKDLLKWQRVSKRGERYFLNRDGRS